MLLLNEIVSITFNRKFDVWKAIMIPTCYKSIFTISIDFELYWGVRDIVSIEEYKANLLGVYEIVPAILDLFHKYGVHATWATVGFLFCNSYEELLANLPEQKPDYADQLLSPYPYIARMENNESLAPFHFAPSLIQKIGAAHHQELGTHTFSHYCCLEDGQTAADFEDDLRLAVRLAEKHQYQVQSLVFPRNQVNPNYLDICKAMGIIAYRGNESAWYYYPQKRIEYRRPLTRLMRLLDVYFDLTGPNTYALPQSKSLPINIPASRLLRKYSGKLKALEPLRLRRITNAMETAARKSEIFHLWFHPHELAGNIKENLSFLEKVLAKFSDLQQNYGMQSLTMAEISRLAIENSVRINGKKKAI